MVILSDLQERTQRCHAQVYLFPSATVLLCLGRKERHVCKHDPQRDPQRDGRLGAGKKAQLVVSGLFEQCGPLSIR